MKNLLNKIPSKTAKRLREIGELAASQGCELYLVGGCVRDLLLDRNLNQDVDICVFGPFQRWMKVLKNGRLGEVLYHPRFQTVVLNYKDGQRFDFAMCRQEGYSSSGALPDVEPGTLAEDLFRRDFTINAMALSLRPESLGELVDYYGGQRDLKERAIRVLHDLSFYDDPTRILRAVRFEQRLNFRIDHRTVKLIKSALKEGRDRGVSGPRYFAELLKITDESCAVAIFQRLARMGGTRLLGKQRPMRWNRLARLNRALIKIDNASVDRKLLMLMGLMEGESLSLINKQISFWQCDRRQAESLRLVALLPDIRRELSKGYLQPSQIYRILNPLPKVVIDYLQYGSLSYIQSAHINLYVKKLSSFCNDLDGAAIQALGVAKGARLGQIKKDLFFAAMDGRVRGRSTEIQFVLKYLKGD